MTKRTDTPSRQPGTSLEPLAYQGHVIHERNEMVSLTDMWRASGSPPHKRPGDWLSYDATKEFVEHIAASLKGGLNPLTEATRGRTGGTWAHWQIALAYMKHLSPAFHAWGNTAIRDRMEAARRPILEAPRRRPGLSPDSARDVAGIHKRSLHANVPDIIDERIPPHLEQLQANILDGVGRLLDSKASQELGPDWITTDGVLHLAGIMKRDGLKGLSRWLSPRLQRYCAALNRPAEQRPHGGVPTWFFRLDLVERYLRDGGREAIEKKVDERRSQRTLPFVDDPVEQQPGRRRSRLH